MDPASLVARATGRRGAVALAALAAALALALAWMDVLPGGWTLRGLVTPHDVREARTRAAHRAERLELFRAETPPEDAVVFLGSSTIERFPLRALFPGARTVDRGIGDEPLARLLARLDASVPPRPAGAVLYAGAVDVRRLARPPADIARDVATLLERLEDRAPGLPIAVLGVLPDRTGDPVVRRRVERLNARLAALALERGAAFIDPHRAPLRTPDGRLDPEHSVDRLHLSARGYEVLAEWLMSEGGRAGTLLRPPSRRSAETPPQ